MNYAPKTLLEVLQQIQYEEALAADDWRYVDTQAARGSEQTFRRLALKLGWDPRTNVCIPPTQKHILFFGHIGCGKTTELRRYATKLEATGNYVTVEMDAVLLLDRNNLQYPEVLAAMAQVLLERLEREKVSLPSKDLKLLHDWYKTLELSGTEYRQIEGEIKTGLEAGGGLPGFLKLFANFTSSAKTGASTKTEWREKVRNTFTRLAEAFSAFIQSAEKALGRRLVFLLDGTDKLRGDDTKQFFIWDAEQLQAIQALVIYTAPLHLKYEGGLGGKLDADLILPMIKVREMNGDPCKAGLSSLKDLLYRRADPSLFAEEAVAMRLVEASGGHPRELLRLLKLTCEYADLRIDDPTVTRAIEQLASEFRRLLSPEDYRLLAAADQETYHPGNDERCFRLLYNLALMEYNDGSWRRSHPVVRTLEAYLAQKPSP